MKTYTHNGCYGEGTSYVLETLENWDEYERLLKEREQTDRKRTFDHFKEEFKEYIGKTWQDFNHIRYCYNGEPVYVEYKVIAIEDDNANRDWYWVVQNVDDDRDIKYLLANDADFKNHIK